MRNLIIIFFIFSCLAAKAHQPDLSTTMLVETSDNQWMLQVRASLTAFEYEVETNYGKDSYSNVEEFKTLVLQHLEEHIAILANSNLEVHLKKGEVLLGHESVINFQLESLPQNIEKLYVVNTSFADIARNQSALVILKKGFVKEQFVLNNGNEHKVELISQDAKFVLVNDEKLPTAFITLSLVLSLFALGMLGLKMKGSNTGID